MIAFNSLLFCYLHLPDKLHCFVAGSCDNIHLLFTGQVDELNSISGYTDCEVCVFRFLRMFHSINQFFCTEYVYVQVVCTLIEVTIQDMYQVVYSFFIIMSQCTRADGLCIGDTIQCQFVWQLGNRVQRSQQTALFCAVRWIRSRCQRLRPVFYHPAEYR